jgi:L-ribulose-5-phosphate 3-epimerase
MKEKRLLLGKGTLDWVKIRDTLQEIGYEGDKWMQIEWAMPDKADIVESYRHNLKFLRELFPGK